MISAPAKTKRKPAFEQFAAIRRYQPTLAFSPDGSEIAYSTNISGQFNLWRQSSGGGYPRQLTLSSEEAVREVRWSPDGERIVFSADRHGDEQYQLHEIPADGGWPERYPGEPDVQHYVGPFSPDGRFVAYAANDREPTDQDVLIREVTSGETRRLLAGEGMFFPSEWSPDGNWLTATKFNSNNDSDVFLISLADGESRDLTTHEGNVRYYAGPWAADGSGFYMVTDEGREFVGIAFYDLATGEKRWVEAPEWDIEAADLSDDGRVLAWVVNEDGYSRLHARDTTTGAAIPLPALPEGVVAAMAIAKDGAKIALLLTTPTRPLDVYVVDVADQRATRITDGFLGGIDESDLIVPELVRFSTFDGKEIPAFLYRPRGEGPFGVVLSIHGGPEAQERPDYADNGLYQYWASRGIGVLAPNVRGSTGYGKSYQQLILRDWGGGDLRDFEAAARYIQGLPWVDPARIGVYGGSYGGFATLSCVTRLPDYWAAAVDIVGPANLVTFAKAVPPTWRRFMTQWVGDPETEADFLMERSPITYVDQVTAPLFVIQGANDPRVVKSESDQIVERLRARGLEVRYDVYEDEGHGFTKQTNNLKATKDTAEFMERYLTRPS